MLSLSVICFFRKERERKKEKVGKKKGEEKEKERKGEREGKRNLHCFRDIMREKTNRLGVEIIVHPIRHH